MLRDSVSEEQNCSAAATKIYIDVEPRLALNEILSDFRGKLLIARRFNEARSRLYRSQILQENTRWKALAEIYKIDIPLHRSDLKISAKNRPRFLE